MTELDIKKTDIGIETPFLSGERGFERLAASVQKLGELIEYTESNANAMGSLQAEEVILANVPDLTLIVGGSLKGARNGRSLGSRIAPLPPEQIDQTQDQIDVLLSTVLSIGNLSSARLSDDELSVIRQGISKISDERAVYELAGDKLRKQLEDEVTDEELLEILTKQIIEEFLSKRCKMAVDLAIRDLGISSDSLLTDPSVLLQSRDSIVANALQYIPFDSPPLRLPNVEIEGFDGNDSAQILEVDQLKCITERNMVDLLEKLAQSLDVYGVRIEQREEVKIYMVDQKARELVTRISRFLADLSKISDKLILPETEDEMSCLLTMVVDAATTGRPLTLITPICPDWSRDSEGKYDFKSLGGGESYIGNKFLTYGREMLAVFARHEIPYQGVLQFADWGLETEINAKDTYGRKLSAEDIQMCFQSTVAATDEHLRSLQLDPEVGDLFANYKIVSMKEFLESKLDIPKVQSELEEFLTTDVRGKRLLDTLAEQSYEINRIRLGLNRDENRKMALRNLVEYATEGQSIGPRSILVVCESRTTSRVYNLPRQKNENIPVFYVKGKEGVDKGVNIL